MSIDTRSQFFYGYTIDSDNYQLDFKEGGGSQLTAELNFGDYTLTTLLTEVKRALETAGALTFTVSVNRSTRKVTIAASGTFSLLTTSGTHGSNVFSLLGFSGADKTGTNTYTADGTSGSAYVPQFKLQSYIPPGNYTKRRNVTVNEAANGLVECVSFGDQDMIAMDIRFSNNIVQPSAGPITSNTSGLADLNLFMRFLITKAALEFMPDLNSPNTFHTVILESTLEDSKGTGYKLKERTDLGIPGYYDTDLLTFRVIEL